MKKRKFLLFAMLIANLLFLLLNLFLLDSQRDYYIGRIEGIEQGQGETIYHISPMPSERYFIKPIKGEHVIHYDNSNISGLSDPQKESRKLRLGEMSEMVSALKVGDPLIVRIEDYDSDQTSYDVSEIAFDLTVE